MNQPTTAGSAADGDGSIEARTAAACRPRTGGPEIESSRCAIPGPAAEGSVTVTTAAATDPAAMADAQATGTCGGTAAVTTSREEKSGSILTSSARHGPVSDRGERRELPEKRHILDSDGFDHCKVTEPRELPGANVKCSRSSKSADIAIAEDGVGSHGTDDIDGLLDAKACKANLSTNNVKAIIQEVLTNADVVAMLRNSLEEDVGKLVPATYEPKMTRAKVKQVLAQEGNAPAPWSLSPAKNRSRGFLFGNIVFSDEEDDEEYQPEREKLDESEDEESMLDGSNFDDTLSPGGDESMLSSPAYSEPQSMMASTPTTAGGLSSLPTLVMPPMEAPEPLPARHSLPPVVTTAMPSPAAAPLQCFAGVEVSKDSEKRFLKALAELEFDPPIAGRTRSKVPLTEKTLECLEAELNPPDVTPDMYGDADHVTVDADDEREWIAFVGSIFTSVEEQPAAEEEENDPDYNILADIEAEEDEGEDDRSDGIVKIPRAEIHNLMDEMVEAFEAEEEAVDVPSTTGMTISEPSSDKAASSSVGRRLPVVKDLVRDSAVKRGSLPQAHSISNMVRYATADCSVPVMTAVECLQVQEHMRKHVQLLLQTFVLTLDVEGLGTHNAATKELLIELAALRDCSPLRAGSFFNSCNLAEATRVVADGDSLRATLHRHCERVLKPGDNDLAVDPAGCDDTVVSSSSSSSSSYGSGSQLASPSTPGHGCATPSAVNSLSVGESEFFANSLACIYPSLLPRQKLCVDVARVGRRRAFMPSEDRLLAMGLEQFEGTTCKYKWMHLLLLPAYGPNVIKSRARRLALGLVKKKGTPSPSSVRRRVLLPVPRIVEVFDHTLVCRPIDWSDSVLDMPQWLKEMKGCGASLTTEHVCLAPVPSPKLGPSPGRRPESLAGTQLKPDHQRRSQPALSKRPRPAKNKSNKRGRPQPVPNTEPSGAGCDQQSLNALSLDRGTAAVDDIASSDADARIADTPQTACLSAGDSIGVASTFFQRQYPGDHDRTQRESTAAGGDNPAVAPPLAVTCSAAHVAEPSSLGDQFCDTPIMACNDALQSISVQAVPCNSERPCVPRAAPEQSAAASLDGDLVSSTVVVRHHTITEGQCINAVVHGTGPRTTSSSHSLAFAAAGVLAPEEAEQLAASTESPAEPAELPPECSKEPAQQLSCPQAPAELSAECSKEPADRLSELSPLEGNHCAVASAVRQPAADELHRRTAATSTMQASPTVPVPIHIPVQKGAHGDTTGEHAEDGGSTADVNSRSAQNLTFTSSQPSPGKPNSIPTMIIVGTPPKGAMSPIMFRTPSPGRRALRPILSATPPSVVAAGCAALSVKKTSRSPRRRLLRSHVRQLVPKGFTLSSAATAFACSPSKMVARSLTQRAVKTVGGSNGRAKLAPIKPCHDKALMQGMAARQPGVLGSQRAQGRKDARKKNPVNGLELQSSHLQPISVPAVADDEDDDLAALMEASTTIRHAIHADAAPTRLKKRKLEKNLACLAADIMDTDLMREEKDTALARGFLARCKAVLCSENTMYPALLTLLADFENGGSTHVQLYNAVRDLLLPVCNGGRITTTTPADSESCADGRRDLDSTKKREQLLTDLAAFMSPEQAFECGPQMYAASLDFYKSRLFLRKLEVYFGRHAAPCQRIVRLLTSWDESRQSLSELKELLLPMLKGHPQLLEDFRAFCLEEPASKRSAQDYEEIDLSSCPDDGPLSTAGLDGGFEEVEMPEMEDTQATEKCQCQCHTGFTMGVGRSMVYQQKLAHCRLCCVKVIGGRLYIHTPRGFKLACISSADDEAVVQAGDEKGINEGSSPQRECLELAPRAGESEEETEDGVVGEDVEEEFEEADFEEEQDDDDEAEDYMFDDDEASEDDARSATGCSPAGFSPATQGSASPASTAEERPAVVALSTVHECEAITSPWATKAASNPGSPTAEAQQSTAEQPSWRRDEDKLILETLRDEETSSDESDVVFQRIADQLHGRTTEQVRSRFRYLLDLFANVYDGALDNGADGTER